MFERVSGAAFALELPLIDLDNFASGIAPYLCLHPGDDRRGSEASQRGQQDERTV
jgi:hypothetical protein